MSNGKVLAVTGAVCFVLGGIALVHSVALEFAARDYRSAAECSPGAQTTDCLERRAIEITDIGTGRYGEVDAVDFFDNGDPHESHLAFGRYDTSALEPGVSGTATLWHGQYTNLDVAGIDFLTDENPLASQGLWRLFGGIGIGFAVIIWSASLIWSAMNRRSANDG